MELIAVILHKMNEVILDKYSSVTVETELDQCKRFPLPEKRPIL